MSSRQIPQGAGTSDPPLVSSAGEPASHCHARHTARQRSRRTLQRAGLSRTRHRCRRRGRHLESLTSTASAVVLWFDPSQGLANPLAAEWLLAATTFTAHTVPLLRGYIIRTGLGSTGNLAGLSQRHVNRLIFSDARLREELILGRLFARDRHHQRHLATAGESTGWRSHSVRLLGHDMPAPVAPSSRERIIANSVARQDVAPTHLGPCAAPTP